MKISFVEAGIEQISIILEMMEDFNSIFGYFFKKITGEQNLNEFINNKSLGRIRIIELNNNSSEYVVLSFVFSFEYK